MSGIDKESVETKATIKNKILARKVYEELLILMDKDTPLEGLLLVLSLEPSLQMVLGMGGWLLAIYSKDLNQGHP